MAHDEDPPELRGYVPDEGKPLRHPMTVRVMRVVIVLGVVGLVVPSLYATIGLQARTAQAECVATLSRGNYAAEPVSRFDLLGPGGPSWYCYARDLAGNERIVASLGLIPG